MNYTVTNRELTEALRKRGMSLKEIRKCRNISQKQLAERSGLIQSHISNIENGRDYKMSTFIKYMKGLRK